VYIIPHVDVVFEAQKHTFDTAFGNTLDLGLPNPNEES
jgi:hypothetical protein